MEKISKDFANGFFYGWMSALGVATVIIVIFLIGSSL